MAAYFSFYCLPSASCCVIVSRCVKRRDVSSNVIGMGEIVLVFRLFVVELRFFFPFVIDVHSFILSPQIRMKMVCNLDMVRLWIIINISVYFTYSFEAFVCQSRRAIVGKRNSNSSVGGSTFEVIVCYC